MKKYLIIFLLFFLLGCGNNSSSINCIVLLDYSASLSNEEFDKYVSMFREGLLKKLKYEDRIILIPIDKASEMKNELIGQCDFRELKKKLSQNISPLRVLSEEDTIRARFDRTLDTLFQYQIYSFRDKRKRFNVETDIIGSLLQATNYLHSGKNAIVIFSDMIQESPEANLKRLFSKTAIEKKISELSETAQIPDLKNAAIFVCGATEKSKKRYRLNKYFWKLFFQKANARLLDYGYGNPDRIANFLEDIRQEEL